MGFLESLMKGEEEKPSEPSGRPFKVSLGFSPLRLGAMKDNKVNLVVRITNISGDEQLVSIDAALPRNHLIGFDPTCINKNIEKKLGKLQANDTTEIVLSIWGNNQSKEGNYPIQVTVYAHYLDYSKVLGSVRKNVSLRVV